MIDIHATIRARLIQNTALVALVGARVYASNDLPAGYKPADGPAVIFNVNGGAPDYAVTLRAAMRFRCYALTESAAIQVDRALFDALHDYRGGIVAHVECDVVGQPLAEPETGWPYVLSYYRAQMVNS